MSENPSKPKIMQPVARMKIIRPSVPLPEQSTQTPRLDRGDEDLSWTDKSSGMFDIPFRGTCRINVQPRDQTPIDYLDLLMTDKFIDLLIKETNVYAESTLRADDKTRAHVASWKPVTRTEMKVFIGLLLHTGIIQLPRLADYWKADNFFRIPIFGKTMNRIRFLLILKCLRFINDSPENASDSVSSNLDKVAPVIEYFNSQMKHLFSPGKHLIVNESMVLWRGRLIFQQFLRSENYRNPIKLYTLTDSSKVILKLFVTTNFDELGKKRPVASVVMKLLEGYTGKGHSVYMSEFYNSVVLSRQLLHRVTYVNGPIRPDRKEIPSDIIKCRLSKGQAVAKYSAGICVTKFRARDELYTISSEHALSMINISNKKGNQRPIPKLISIYNNYKSTDDVQDEMMSYYPCERKIFKWYRKLAIHVIQLMVLNSYYLYNKYSGKTVDMYDFRLSVIKTLIPRSEISTPNSPRRTIIHLPRTIERDKSGKKVKKQCKRCSTHDRNRMTLYCCPACTGMPPLCLEPCFKKYHLE